MTNPVAKLHIGTEDDAALTVQTLFVEGAKTGYANYAGLPQNQLCLYDNRVSTAGSGGAIGFGANCGGSQQTWIAAIESQRDSGTNDASNYAGSIVFGQDLHNQLQQKNFVYSLVVVLLSTATLLLQTLSTIMKKAMDTCCNI